MVQLLKLDHQALLPATLTMYRQAVILRLMLTLPAPLILRLPSEESRYSDPLQTPLVK